MERENSLSFRVSMDTQEETDTNTASSFAPSENIPTKTQEQSSQISRRGFLKAMAGIGAGVALSASGLSRRVEAADEQSVIESLPEVIQWPNSLELVPSEGEVQVITDVQTYVNGLPLNAQTSIRDAINIFDSYSTDKQIDSRSAALVIQAEKSGQTLQPTLEPTPTPDNPNAIVVPAYFSLPYEGYFVVPNQEGKLSVFREDNAQMVGSVVEDISKIDEKTSEMASSLYIKPEGSGLGVIDRNYPHLGVVTVGTPYTNEGGQNEIVWNSNYKILENSRLRTLSYSKDGAIGREAMPAYVRINDAIKVDNLNLTLELASAMSVSGTNPYDSKDCKFTPEFQAKFIEYANRNMADLSGKTIRVKFLDETDESMLEYLSTTSVENEQTVKLLNIMPKSNRVPLYGFAGNEYPDKNLIEYNIFLNRVIIPNWEAMMTATTMSAIIFADAHFLSPWRGSPSDQIPGFTEKTIALGVDPSGRIDSIFAWQE